MNFITRYEDGSTAFALLRLHSFLSSNGQRSQPSQHYQPSLPHANHPEGESPDTSQLVSKRPTGYRGSIRLLSLIVFVTGLVSLLSVIMYYHSLSQKFIGAIYG